MREAKSSDMGLVKLLDKQTVWEQMEKEERSVIKDFDKYHDKFWRRMAEKPGISFYVAEDSDE